MAKAHNRLRAPLDLSAYRPSDGNPKLWLRTRLGLANWSDARLLEAVLEQPELSLPDGSPLPRIINSVIAAATEGSQQ